LHVNLARDLLWCRPFRRPILEPKVNRSLFPRLALVGLFAATTLLAACGRKGPLDPPPGAVALDQRSGLGAPGGQAPPPAYDQDGRPIAPPGSRRQSPLDWLID